MLSYLSKDGCGTTKISRQQLQRQKLGLLLSVVLRPTSRTCLRALPKLFLQGPAVWAVRERWIARNLCRDVGSVNLREAEITYAFDTRILPVFLLLSSLAHRSRTVLFFCMSGLFFMLLRLCWPDERGFCWDYSSAAAQNNTSAATCCRHLQPGCCSKSLEVSSLWDSI